MPLLSLYPQDIELEGDCCLLRQVLINLLVGAVRHTSSGSIRLSVRLDEEQGQERARFEVIDTGSGFNPSKAAALFLPNGEVRLFPIQG